MRQTIKPILALMISCAALSGASCSEAKSAEQVASPVKVTTTQATTAVNWDIQSSGSHIKFSALQEGEAFEGAFDVFSGVIDFNPNAPESASVEITIPLSGVDAGSTDRNSTLPGKVWFSTRKFPDAVFTSNEISKTDEGYLAKGELSLKGKSVPLDLPFRLDIEGAQAVMTSQITIDRTLWNVGSDPWNTDEWVSREVKLDLQVTAIRQ